MMGDPKVDVGQLKQIIKKDGHDLTASDQKCTKLMNIKNTSKRIKKCSDKKPAMRVVIHLGKK